MSEQARWWPDPYGRFEQRYFDGSNWTAHVIGNGVQSVDPLGVSVSVPFATPASAAPAKSLQPGDLLDSLGPDARERPPVKLSIALAGAGGAAAATGVAAAIIGDGIDNRARNIAAAVVVVALAYAIRLSVKSQAELRSAAVGAGIVGIPLLAAAATSTDTNGATGGGTLVLAAVLLIAAWVLPGMRGRPLMLGAGAVAIVLASTTIGDGSSDGTDLFGFGPADIIGGQTWVFVIVGIAFLALVWWLDEQGYRGAATSLIVAAVLATALAVVKVIEDLGSTGSALLLTVAGLLVAIVGDHGQRRASTWFGVAVAAIGTIAVFASAFEPNSTAETATTLIIAGLVLIVAPAVVKSVRDSRATTAPPTDD